MQRLLLFVLLSVSLLCNNSVLAIEQKHVQVSGYVTDQAKVLSEQEEQNLATKLQALNQERNAQGAIVLVQNTSGSDIETYATDLFRRVGIGDKTKNNGFLIVIAIEDKLSRFEVGYGLEGVITDSRAARILDGMRGEFRNGEYGKGLEKAIKETDLLLAGDEDTRQRLDARGVKNAVEEEFGFLFVLLFAVFPWIAAILARSRSWWAGGLVGAGIGTIIGLFFGWIWIGIAAVLFLSFFGLLTDFVVSKLYTVSKVVGGNLGWWAGGSGGKWWDSDKSSWGGGGFGGFGGGSSGGGGASSSW